MNTEIDLENELVQLIVEEAVRAGLQSPLRTPILEAVESVDDDHVELVEPEASGVTAGPGGSGEADDAPSLDAPDEAAEEQAPNVVEVADDGDEDDGSAAEGKGTVTKAVQGLVVFVAMFTVLYLTLRRLTGDD